METGAVTDDDHHGTLFRQVAIVVVPFVEDGGLVRFVSPGSRAAVLMWRAVWRGGVDVEGGVGWRAALGETCELPWRSSCGRAW